MKVTFTILSTGTHDADTAYDVLQDELSNCSIETVLYDNLILEIDADGGCREDIPAEIQDAIDMATRKLEKDFDISLEIDSTSAA